MIRYRVEVGAWRMHVMERGAGPTVLLMHGNPTWGFLYRKVVAELGDGFRVIVPDLIGLGLSDKPHHSCEHTLENHISWVSRLIEELDLKDVIVVGQDWGGPIAFGAASEHADRIAGLVVLNTVIGPPRPGFKTTAFHRFARAPFVSDLVFRVGQFPQIRLGVAQGDPKSMAGGVGRAYRYPLRRFRDRQAPLALARMVPDTMQHHSIPALERVHEFLSGFQGPSAIVWGKKDPILGSVLGHVRRTLPNAPVTETDAGHFLQEEVPVEIAAAIRDVAARAQLS
ncbi:MAG: haloalkane dehalogenase [Bradymonadia bacterium]|jgi:haloalkane dehalogenase